MRQHKYRAWHKIEKRMISSAEIKDQSGDLWAIGFHGLPIAVDQDSFKDGNVTGWNIDHLLEPLEYTGHKDTKGTEIYENHIVKDRWGILWKVQWNEEKAQFELAWYGGPQPEYYRVGMYLIKDCQCIIIGSTHENPELAPETKLQ